MKQPTSWQQVFQIKWSNITILNLAVLWTEMVTFWPWEPNMSYFYLNSLNIRRKGHLIQLMDRPLRSMLMFLPHIVTCPTMKQCKLTKTANKQSNQIKPRNLSNFIYARENEQPRCVPILHFFLQNISCLKENNIIKLTSTISIFFP